MKESRLDMAQCIDAAKKACWLLLCLMLLMRAFVWMQQNMPEFPTQSLEEYVDGTGRTPFAYRALLPKTVAAIEYLTPQTFQQPIANMTRDIVTLYSAMIWTPTEIWTKPDRFFFLRFTAAALMLGLLIGYALALYRLANLLMPQTMAGRIAPLLGLYLIPIGSWKAAYLYDAGTLFFTAWAFYLLLTGRLKAYLFCFMLACFNRETAFYLMILSALIQLGTMPRRSYYGFLAVQCLLWGAITLLLRTIYGDNLGSYSLHLLNNLRLAIGGFELINGLSIIVFLFVLAYGWQQKPELLRKTIWIIALAAALWLGFGRIQEVRAIYDVFPFLTLMLSHSLAVAINGMSNAGKNNDS
ncbi:MAG: hypothetical protein LW823_06695 [Rickettsiales bacterium]|jgi:hypothetical protein|nr:hypothetical protein [Rickettsiales bacterium]